MGIFRKVAIGAVVFLIVAGAGLFYLAQGQTAELSVDEVTGTDPVLAEPSAENFPTVQIAEPVGWEEGDAPVGADGFVTNRFAEGLDHPRVLYALPNGDVLVTLTRAPASDEDAEGQGFFDTVRGWIAGFLWVIKDAGA